MIRFTRILLKDFIKKYNPPTPTKETIENFEKEINSLLENAPRQDDEEFQKNEINKFLDKISSIKERYAYKSAVLKNAFLNNDKLLKHAFLSGIRN
ncbi:hypothetical protein ID0436_13960 [Helicobacter pylori]|uniref:DUF7149 domain-containing protein n=1 Tax=Helicobacter pylori TaxID=210 RepID=UPI0004141853|nr:hypothetical protein [Helicobacter pylori]WQU96678.1 hypothetical protein KVL42_07340 [Helicobacter pylori]WQW00588.1 hypothetical protein KVM21_06900 [Helicobacter pylori]